MTGSLHLVEGYEVWDDRLYSPDHLWVKLEPGSRDLVRVGLDDYLQQTLGLVTRIGLPRPGAGQGEPLAILTITRKECYGDVCNYRTEQLELPFPVEGEVVAVNESLLADPFLLQEDPAEQGWIARLRLSAAGRSQLADLHQGDQVEPWLRSEIQKEKEQ